MLFVEHTVLPMLSAHLVLLSKMGKPGALEHCGDMKIRHVCPKVFMGLSLKWEQS